MRKYFGTDGVRGIAGKHPMNAEFAFKLGVAAAEVLMSERQPTFLIGRDTRRSSTMLTHAVSAGLTSRGSKVIDIGVIPTPGISYLCGYLKADAGFVISASHNPFEDNGIKLFNAQGEKLSDAIEIEIESKLETTNKLPEIIGEAIGISEIFTAASNAYLDFLKTNSPDLSGLHIGLDCANGASYHLVPELFTSLGAKVEAINIEPDGININVNCGSTHPETLQQYVKDKQLELGITFDGDADRVLLVDNKGRLVTGDHILAICGLARGEDAVVSTVMGNMGAQVYLEEKGVTFHRAKVGDRYVKEMLSEKGLTLGGEQSGHMLFLDKAPTGDGMFSALQVLAAVKQTNKPLEAWVDEIIMFPQVLKNASVPTKIKGKIAELTEVKFAVNEAESKLANKGRVNLRPSGTEPLVRVMVEGPEQKLIEEIANDLVEIIGKVSKEV